MSSRPQVWCSSPRHLHCTRRQQRTPQYPGWPRRWRTVQALVLRRSDCLRPSRQHERALSNRRLSLPSRNGSFEVLASWAWHACTPCSPLSVKNIRVLRPSHACDRRGPRACSLWHARIYDLYAARWVCYRSTGSNPGRWHCTVHHARNLHVRRVATPRRWVRRVWGCNTLATRTTRLLIALDSPRDPVVP